MQVTYASYSSGVFLWKPHDLGTEVTARKSPHRQFFPMVHTALPEDKYVCNNCGSSHVDIYEYKKKKVQACLDCGQEEIISGKD